MGVTIQVSIKDERVRGMLRRLQRRLGDLTPFFSRVGAHMITSIDRNFRAGGRPRWRPLSPVTIEWARRRHKGLRGIRDPNRPLVDTGRLKGSTVFRAAPDHVRIGTNVVYGAIHQRGGRTRARHVPGVGVREHARRAPSGTLHTVRAHTRRQFVPGVRIPARPFLVVQPEDWRTIERIAKQMLMEAAR